MPRAWQGTILRSLVWSDPRPPDREADALTTGPPRRWWWRWRYFAGWGIQPAAGPEAWLWHRSLLYVCRCLQQYTSTINHVCTAMSVKWNAVGTYLTALRRHLPPVLYRVDRLSPIAEFCHPGYKNVYTMKNSCFGGDKDQVTCGPANRRGAEGLGVRNQTECRSWM